jgi:predicted phage baseplate assembly protein
MATGTRRHQHSAEEQERALQWLIHREDHLLAAKLRRLDVLIRRMRAGTLLSAADLWEIGQMWGAAYLEGLDPSSPAYLGPARDALQQDPRVALPALTVTVPDAPDGNGGGTWQPVRDLLESGPDDRVLVAEVDNDGYTHLRFGRNDQGRAIDPGVTPVAHLRLGNGISGNVGRDAISHLVLRDGAESAVTRVRNPLPAAGGVDPEPLADVKLFAPATFRRQLQRAITADDYAQLADDVPGVQRAAAQLRWEGSWYEAQVAIDPLGTDDADEQLQSQTGAYLYPYRRIGHDLVVRQAQYVPLDIALQVCVLPTYLRAHVEADLLDLFSNRVLRNGRRGFFHPDNLTFGRDIEASRLVALAQAVPGVQSVTVTRLQRLFEGDQGELAQGVLHLGPFEVARLDNDRGAPENGKLRLDMGGGR